MLRKIMLIKTNVFGTIAIAILSSACTILFSQFLTSINVAGVPSPQQMAMTSASSIQCEDGVYSPVQRGCVDQSVFDAEMKRLFAALGIDTSIYNLENKN